MIIVARGLDFTVNYPPIVATERPRRRTVRQLAKAKLRLIPSQLGRPRKDSSSVVYLCSSSVILRTLVNYSRKM